MESIGVIIAIVIAVVIVLIAIEDKLETPERTGFVVVEWGGSNLDDKKILN